MNITLFAMGLIAVAVALWHAARKQNDDSWDRLSLIFLIVTVGFAVRLMASTIPYEYSGDIGCFKGWADQLFANGPQKFYTSDGFTDYPPGYMYVLMVMGAIRSWLGMNDSLYASTLIIKLPAILADLGLGVLIYCIAETRMKRQNAFAAALLYVLNPAVILISACWGQVDSVHTLLIVASIYFMTEKKLLKSSLLFAVAVLVKPQSLMFTPLFMFAYFMRAKEQGFKAKALLELAEYILICLLMFVVLLLPFAQFESWRFDIGPVLNQYKETLASYPSVTVNAYNIYALFGLNWASIDKKFMGIVTYDTLGIIMLVLIVLAALYLLWRANEKSKSKYFFVAAFLNFSTFIFSVKMHERYSFPIMALLLVACVMNSKKIIKYLYMAVSAAFFFNYFDVLRIAKAGNDYSVIKHTLPIFSFVTVVLYGVLLYVCIEYKRNAKDEVDSPEAFGGMLRAFGAEQKPFEIETSQPKPKYTWRDFAVMGGVTLVYAIVAFMNLGNTASPQSSTWLTKGQVVVMEFAETEDWSRMQYFLGARHDKDFTLEFSEGGGMWSEPMGHEANSVFCWGEMQMNVRARFVRFTAQEDEFQLMEIAFRNSEGAIVTPVNVSYGGEGLVDEQNLVPERRSYLNGTYFDEIYHARTAYEFEEGLNVYEWTHPPLGKVFLNIGVKLFGMTPFGWRSMGTLFGVLMLPLIYLFAKRLFRKTWWASLAIVLFAADFMHFAQTRIATIDTYITFFVIAMYYFMYQYYSMTFYTPERGKERAAFRKTLVPLALSGLCMGLGIACKWPGVYAGLGLAVLFFLTLFRRYREYLYAKKYRIEGNYRMFPKYALYTCLWCLLFFVLVPALIYVLSYIPYYFGTGSLYPVREANRLFTELPAMKTLLPDNTVGNFLAGIIQNQRDIFDYHSDLVSEHPFSSHWWQWILNVRPIFYYASAAGEGMREGLSSFGNPLVWYGGLIAIFALFEQWWRKLDKKIVFLFVAYLAQLLPWALVSRTTYIYHYFPCVPFLVLFLVCAMKKYCGEGKLKYISVGIMVAAVVLFAMFYPVLTGTAVQTTYVDAFLKWFPSWQLI